jgi:uncharacterized protein (TIGR02453 family)
MLEKSTEFLRILKKNNDRTWFNDNKKLYTEAKQEFEHITELLIHEVSRYDRSIAGLTPKDCVFRIFRDVRFSADKSPYKTNFGAFLVPGGRKSVRAGYYIHIEPGESFVAGGIYMPPAPMLKAVRSNIVEHIDEFLEIINEPKLKKQFGELSGEKLKKPPQGFPKDFPNVELLKFKSYGLIKMVSDLDIKQEHFVKEVVDLFRLMQPFITFLNESEEFDADRKS